MKKITFLFFAVVFMLSVKAQTVYQNYVVTGNETWDNSNHPQGVWIQQLLRIDNGATLTITGIDVKFSQPAEIIVETSGTLIGNTASFKPHQSFNYWKGFTVKGDPNESQYAVLGNPNPQGILLLNSNSIVEKANMNKAWGGAIIKAKDVTFINNNIGFLFDIYFGFYPIPGEPPAPNVSYFHECHFEVNDTYSLPDNFTKHVSINVADGIKFRGCSFANNMTNAVDNGVGIEAWDAGFSVKPGCGTPGMLPCPDPIPSQFNGFENGIYAYTWYSTPIVFVDHAIFNNNGFGIKLEAIDNVTIINSQFNVGQSLKGMEQCDAAYGVGVYLHHCVYYTVENNTFTGGYSGNPNTLDNYIGIWTDNLYDFPMVVDNEIYRNTFSHLTDANLATGKHNYFRDGNWWGLQYICNNNSSNKFDFRTGPYAAKGIALKQGSLQKAAGNTFSGHANPVGSDFLNQAIGINWLQYFYHNTTNQFPDNSWNIIRTEVTNANPCTDNYGGGSGQIDLRGLTNEQKSHFEQMLLDNQITFDNVKSLYTSLEDGGNTEALLTEVEMAWPEDMWELRAQLLNLSPHLSKDALITTADKTDVFPQSVIFEILAANPDELRNEDLMQYLEDKENPLPQYMIDILQQLTGSVTYKTVLKSQMSHHNSLKNHAYKVLLQDMLSDSTSSPSDIRAFLASAQSLATDMMVVDSYLKEGNTADALALAAMLPSLYNISGDELDEYNLYFEMKQLQATLIGEGRSVLELDAQELAQIEMLATASQGRTATQAQGVLRQLYGNEYPCCPPMPDAGLKSMAKPKRLPIQAAMKPQITAGPNPANIFVNFSFELPDGQTSGVISITDANGRLIESIHVNSTQGQTLWDVRGFVPGVYYYTLKAGESSKSGKIILGK
jgi:hypothetical protein